MTPSKELLARLLADFRPDSTNPDVATYLARRLAEIGRIRTALGVLDHQDSVERDRHRKAMVHLQQERDSVRRACPHLETTYQADPAGGSDSCTTCDHCGSVLGGGKR